MKTVRFGIIGCGLMGREFASAIARWCHFTDLSVRPELVAVCNRRADKFTWFKRNFPTIEQATSDYRALLANPRVDAVYAAVPHHLHREVYCAAIEAGKHLLGEKPFGMNRHDFGQIAACAQANPDVFVRCSSEFPFFPAVQRIGRLVEQQAFGRILEVNAGFLHSSDLDPHKPASWKRQRAQNGEYGCLGDLGLHVCHVPLRAGWIPQNVRAILSKVFSHRPGPDGMPVACDTWDNATLLCEATDPGSGALFPLLLKTQRIAPGEKNSWYLEVLGTAGAARFSTKNPKRLELLKYEGGEQIWGQIDMGYEAAFPGVTGGNFEFGFSDAFQQMCAAYLHELTTGHPVQKFAGCVTLEEVSLSHALFTGALDSNAQQCVVALRPCETGCVVAPPAPHFAEGPRNFKHHESANQTSSHL